MLFFPVVPRRSLVLRAGSGASDGLAAAVEAEAPLARGAVPSRLAGSAAGAAAVGLALAVIDASSSNTGLAGGLLVVVSGGLLIAGAGALDCLRPRIANREGGPE